MKAVNVSDNTLRPIVFIDDAHTFGGAQTGLAWAVHAIIHKTRHSVICVCPPRTREAIANIAGPSDRLRFIECPKALPLNVACFPLRILPFFQILRRLRQQGVTAWWLNLSGIEFCLAPLLVLKFMGQDYTSWIHCTEAFSILIRGRSLSTRFLSSARDFIANHFLFRLHSVLVTPSEAASETIRKRTFAHPALHHLYYCPAISGVDDRDCDLQNRTSPTLWMIGRIFFGHKNNLAAIDTFRELKKRGINTSLRIVGDGPDIAALRTSCNDLKPSDGLTFSGWTSNPWLDVDTDDIVLIPSFWEGMPLVAIEAMLRGIRIVTSPIPMFYEGMPKEFIAKGFAAGEFADQVEHVSQMSRTEVSALYSQALAKFSAEHFLRRFAGFCYGNMSGSSFAEAITT